jgi:hypothetical protein
MSWICLPIEEEVKYQIVDLRLEERKMVGSIPWVLVAVLALLITFLFVYLVKRSKKEKRETDYRNLFNMGVIWLIIGAALEINDMNRGEGFDFNALLILGLIFTLAGVANKNKWSEKT